MADLVNDIVTMEAAKGHLRIAGTEFDQVLSDIITGISHEANRQTNRLLMHRTLTEYYDGNGTDTLYLRNYPITKLTSVHDDTEGVYGAGTLMTDLITYKELGRLVSRNSIFDKGRQNVKVVYEAGYTAVTLPGDMQLAVFLEVDYLFQRWKNNELGISARTLADGSITIEEADLLPTFTRIMRTYRRPLTGAWST